MGYDNKEDYAKNKVGGDKMKDYKKQNFLIYHNFIRVGTYQTRAFGKGDLYYNIREQKFFMEVDDKYLMNIPKSIPAEKGLERLLMTILK